MTRRTPSIPLRNVCAAAACVAALAATPSRASPFDFLFGGSSGGEPAASAPAAPAGSEPARTAPRGMPVTAILPPKRPPGLAGAEAAEPAPTPVPANAPAPVATRAGAAEDRVVTAAATPANAPAAASAPEAPLGPAAIVERANAYFNSLSTLVANFVQVGGDGRRLTGTLYVHRPGKLRFEYDSPATLEVIADGSSVAVRDRKLVTQDLYPVWQTPLKFLLRPRVELGRDLKVTGAVAEAEGVRLSLEDSSTLGGTSKITLFFDPAVETLTRWRIVDPQGFQTTVSLSNPERGRRVDPKLFVINYERMLATPN